MNTLAFLLVPLLIAAVVSTAVYLRSREPTSVESGVRDFSREMRALSPEQRERRGLDHGRGLDRVDADAPRVRPQRPEER